MSNYENLFYPSASESLENKHHIEELITLDTPALQRKYVEYQMYLDELRKREPSRKQNNKTEYRIWLKRTHDYLDILNAIARELELR